MFQVASCPGTGSIQTHLGHLQGFLGINVFIFWSDKHFLANMFSFFLISWQTPFGVNHQILAQSTNPFVGREKLKKEYDLLW